MGDVRDANEALFALVFLPVIEAVDFMEPGKNAVLPWMISGLVFGENSFSGWIQDGVEVRPCVRFGREGGERDPIGALGRLGLNDEFMVLVV